MALTIATAQVSTSGWLLMVPYLLSSSIETLVSWQMPCLNR